MPPPVPLDEPPGDGDVGLGVVDVPIGESRCGAPLLPEDREVLEESGRTRPGMDGPRLPPALTPHDPQGAVDFVGREEVEEEDAPALHGVGREPGVIGL